MLRPSATKSRWTFVRRFLVACAAGCAAAPVYLAVTAYRPVTDPRFRATAPLLPEETAARLGAVEFRAIEFPTYDGLNQVAHPSAVVFPRAWHGFRYWMALTPYPFSNPHLENPSVYASADGRDWMPPSGTSNPVVLPDSGHLSDPNLVYDPRTDRLRLYYRRVLSTFAERHNKVHIADDLFVTSSADGSTWTTPRRSLRDSNHVVVSPAVVRRAAGDWLLWQVDAGSGGCDAAYTRVVRRRSRDGLAWGPAEATDFDQPGYVVWHIDVQYVPARQAYWALFAAFPRGRGCNATSLFLATSADGMRWTTYPTAVIAPGAAPQFGANVYKSTFHVDAGGAAVTMWLTGADLGPHPKRKSRLGLRWSAAMLRTTTDSLFARLNRAPAGRTLGEPGRDQEWEFVAD